MLTVSRQDADLFDALRAGASGYLLKDIDEDRLGAALQQVLRGEASLPGTLVTRFVEEFRDREARRVPLLEQGSGRLTGREWDVLELMRAGLTTNEMADGCSSPRPPSARTSRRSCASCGSTTASPLSAW